MKQVNAWALGLRLDALRWGSQLYFSEQVLLLCSGKQLHLFVRMSFCPNAPLLFLFLTWLRTNCNASGLQNRHLAYMWFKPVVGGLILRQKLILPADWWYVHRLLLTQLFLRMNWNHFLVFSFADIDPSECVKKWVGKASWERQKGKVASNPRAIYCFCVWRFYGLTLSNQILAWTSVVKNRM